MVASIVLLFAPEFVRFAVPFVAAGLVLRHLLDYGPIRTSKPPHWRLMSIIALLTVPFFTASAGLGVAAWAAATRDHPDLPHVHQLLWDAELVERIGWIFYDIALLYLWCPTIVLAVFPSIGLRHSHLFAIFIFILILRVSVRILTFVALGVESASTVLNVTACVLITLQTTMLSIPAALVSCVQRPRAPLTLRAVPWMPVCVALAFELASVGLRINYGASDGTQASMRLAGAISAVLAVSTVLVLFHAPVPADPDQGQIVTIRIPRDFHYLSAQGRVGGLKSASGTRPSADLISRDPFASPPPGSSPVRLRRPTVVSNVHESHGKHPNSEKDLAQFEFGQRDSNSLTSAFDAAFLERLISLSFSSRPSSKGNPYNDTTKRSSRDSGFGDSVTGGIVDIRTPPVSRSSGDAPRSAPNARRSAAGSVRVGIRREMPRRRTSEGDIFHNQRASIESRIIDSPRSTITFPSIFELDEAHGSSARVTPRQPATLRMVTDRPPTPANTLSLLSASRASHSPQSSVSPSTPSTISPVTIITRSETSTSMHGRALGRLTPSWTSPKTPSTGTAHNLGSPARLNQLTQSQNLSPLFGGTSPLLSTLSSPAASSADWTRGLASPLPSYAASPRTPLASPNYLASPHNMAHTPRTPRPASMHETRGFKSPLATSADWTRELDLRNSGSGSSDSNSSVNPAGGDKDATLRPLRRLSHPPLGLGGGV